MIPTTLYDRYADLGLDPSRTDYAQELLEHHQKKSQRRVTNEGVVSKVFPSLTDKERYALVLFIFSNELEFSEYIIPDYKLRESQRFKIVLRALKRLNIEKKGIILRAMAPMIAARFISKCYMSHAAKMLFCKKFIPGSQRRMLRQDIKGLIRVEQDILDNPPEKYYVKN